MCKEVDRMVFFYKLEGPAFNAAEQLKREMVQKAIKELKLREDALVTRDIRPEDVGLTTPEWTFNITTANAWNTLIDNKTIADNRFVGIYGVFYPMSATSVVTQLEISRKGRTARYWQIQGTQLLENLSIYFSDPIIIDQNTPITVKGYATATSTAEKLALLGIVVEKRGLLVNP